MFKKFYPYEYVQNVFKINYKALYNKGYRGIIFDIDNTLVHHGDNSTAKVDELFRNIQSIGFKTLILSNNNEERVLRFLKNINSLYICDAEKPNTAGYIKAMKMMNLKKEEVVVIGDQIFTDILGANKSKIPSILVKFIQLDNEVKIGKRREVEKIILKFYQKNKSCQHRIGDITKKENDKNVI